jgi:hypothetical protein
MSGENKPDWEFEKRMEIINLELQLSRARSDLEIHLQRAKFDFENGLLRERLQKELLFDFKNMVNDRDVKVIGQVFDILRKQHEDK